MSDASQLAPGPDTGPETDTEETTNAADPLVGQLVDSRYRVIERLAEGGMGTVYRAEHVALHKEVAIKLVQDSGNADHAMRFLREAVLTSRIDHPNVISALDYGTFDQGSAYLVMSLVDGPTLASVMRSDAPMSWLRAADIGAQIADAVGAAQAQGIVHRDLKPENVVLQPAPSGGVIVKVLDFGIAKYARDSLAPPQVLGAQRVTRLGVVVGTPGYMAPEQAVGMRADHRADLYAIGVMLWECVVGRRLWEHSDVQQLVTAQLGTRPPLVRAETGDPTIPEAFEKLIAQLLSTRPEGRPQTAIETRDRLRALVDAERSSQPRAELSADADAESVAAIRPPDTDTVFINAAIAGLGARAKAPASEPEPIVESDGPPTAPFLRPKLAEAAPQPATQVGFRAAAPPLGDAPAADNSEVALAADECAAQLESSTQAAATRSAVAAEPELEPAIESTGGSAEVSIAPPMSRRGYAAVGLAGAGFALLLWSALSLNPSAPPSARPYAPAQPATKPVQNMTSAASAPAAAPTPSPAKAATAPAVPAARIPVSSLPSAPLGSPRSVASSRTLPAKRPEPPVVGPGATATAGGHESAAELRSQALVHFRSAEFEVAAQIYRRAIKAGPEYAGAYAGLGASQLALGDARGAIASYRQALRRSPDSSGFHAALGRAYVMARDRTRAIAEYRKAVALDPSNDIAVKALAALTPL